ncbi:MAG: DNA-formamidopyrimidine glycosylase, partial [Nanoarchaeota archaeon]|nr:DNA-formamidopyrimidine glycosylase [Nanoarchaeota archaeon]
QWYRHTDGSKGHYQEHFKVYGRTGERCLRCGAEIQYSKLAGRGTFWCPKCQRERLSD